MKNPQTVVKAIACQAFGLLLLAPCLLSLMSTQFAWCQESVSSSRQAQSFRIQKSDLLNGLRTLVVEQKDLPLVSVNLLVRAGSMYDPPSSEGVAFLLANSLFHSNQIRTVEQWKDELEELSVDFKIRVEPEGVVFQGNVPAHNLEAYLNSLSIMILHPVFRQENLESARRQVESQPSLHPGAMEIADQIFRSIVFNKHPYGKPVSGNLESLNRIRPEELEKFYRSYYLPNNSALIVVGDVLSSQIMNSAREKWGSWTKSIKPSLMQSKLTIQDRFSIRLVPTKKGNEAAIVYGHLGPSRLTNDFYSLRVLATLLAGNGTSSRLSRECGSQELSCQGVRGDFTFYQDGGLFWLATQVPSHSATGTLKVMVTVIDTLKQTRVSDGELKSVQESLIKEFRESLNLPGKVADYVTAIELYDLASDFLLTYAGKIGQVSAERVQEAAKTYLDTSHAVTVVVGDGEDLADELQKDVGPVEILTPPPNMQ